jgi:tyrosyl-tRNA synthetase
MEAVTISQITEGLRKLPAEKLAVVYDFISFLAERESYGKMLREAGKSYAIDTMLASEAVLRRDWDSPEEDEAWANL